MDKPERFLRMRRSEEIIIEELDEYLTNEDLVILVDIAGTNPMTDMLCTSEALDKTDKRVAVISTANYSNKQGNHIYRTVTEEDMKTLLDIYRSYEASDHLALLSDSRIYGSIWNYVSNGLLSADEMFGVLLM